MSGSPTNIASSMAPSFRMVSKYFAASVAFFVLVCLLLALYSGDLDGHHFQPKFLAITHALALGWITMIIFGAMFQLVPVVLEVKLFSERLATAQFWMFTAGVLGLATNFWAFRTDLHLTISAIVTTLACLVFVFNIILTMTRVRQWNLTGWFLLAAIIYLALTSIAGTALAINLGMPYLSRNHLDYLKIHAHLGFIGWVLMVIMGIGLKLIPMFTLSHGYSTTPAKVAFAFTNVGLLGLTIEWLLNGPRWLMVIYAALVVFGIAAFLAQLVQVFRHRLKKSLDVGMKHTGVAFGFVGVSMVLGVILLWRSQESIVLAYGFAVLIGSFSVLVVGQMYKILPFLVWFHTYSDRAGKEPVPMLKDMFSERIGTLQFWLLCSAVALSTLGFGLPDPAMRQIGLALLFISSVLFAINMATIFRHRFSYDDSRSNSRRVAVGDRSGIGAECRRPRVDLQH